ncbi:MAG TPA: large conductance mechanosensitive channel protein MscL, partial [Clostridia bacterium]|nr:large conductance mechanosensitive channel protein MscL [Clostridia bacterium]
IIGGAFGKIVSSLVNDIITPIIGILIGGISFEHLQYQFGSATIKYGLFIQNVIDFLIISISIFIFIKLINSFKKKKEETAETPPAPSKEELLLSEIRDLLKDSLNK